MKRDIWTRERVASVLISMGAWTLVMMLFVFIRFYGIEEEALVQVTGNRSEIMSLMWGQGMMLGVVLGGALSVLDTLVDRRVLRNLSYLQLIVIRSLGHILITVPMLGLTILVMHKIMGLEEEASWIELLSGSPFARSAAVLLIYTGFFSVLFNILRQISNMFGPGILFKLISGRYHHPKEEERIFLFLDLRSSTTYAERLGHVRYSELIQDCFSDLTTAIEQHKVEVYQYVGDEAVLTWSIKNGIEDNNVIKAFFTFEASIQRRADYYFNKYNLVPVFKAGANCGVVMAAEVGVIKKEIAYHSDVLNTAARIQGRCNDLGESLLISDALKERLQPDPGYSIDPPGLHMLKGKKMHINIFRVRLKAPIVHKYRFSE